MFKLSKEQKEKADRFIKYHKCKNSIPVRISYIFTSTGIGCIVIVKCDCGKEIDITDVNSW